MKSKQNLLKLQNYPRDVISTVIQGNAGPEFDVVNDMGLIFSLVYNLSPPYTM